MKNIGILCLLIPFVFSALEIQSFITLFMSVSLGQLSVYVNLILVMIGTLIFFNDREDFAPIVKIWIAFFIFYYAIGTCASIVYQTPSPFLSSLIPVIYFLGFAVFLSSAKHQKLFIKTVVISFSVATLFLIVFQRLNFSMVDGVYTYRVERAAGIYGDANKAAVGCLLTIVLIYHFFKAQTKLQSVLKLLLLGMSVYALILTFSKTGFLVLIIISALTFYKLITPKRILISVFVLPFVVITAMNTGVTEGSLLPAQQERLQDIANILTFNTQKVDFSGRDVLLQKMLNYVYDNPILGYGISFSNIIRGHNTIIGVWADAGIVPFLLFLFILFQYFFKSWNAPTEKRFFALSAIIILAVFMLSLQSIINQPYLMAILVYLAYFIETKKNTIQESLS